MSTSLHYIGINLLKTNIAHYEFPALFGKKTLLIMNSRPSSNRPQCYFREQTLNNTLNIKTHDSPNAHKQYVLSPTERLLRTSQMHD